MSFVYLLFQYLLICLVVNLLFTYTVLMGKFDYKSVLKATAKRGVLSSTTGQRDTQKRKNVVVSPTPADAEGTASKRQNFTTIPDTEVVVGDSRRRTGSKLRRSNFFYKGKPFGINLKPGIPSLWVSSFNPNPMIDSHILHTADARMIMKHGHKASVEATELYLLRSVAMMRFWSKELDDNMERISRMQAEFEKVEKMKADQEKVVQERDSLYFEKEKLSTQVNDLNSELEVLKKKLAEVEPLKKRLTEVEEEKSSMTSDLESAKKSVQDLEAKISSQHTYYEKELKEAKFEIFNHHIAGFDKAVVQIRHFNPDVDTSSTDVNEELKDGVMVPIEMDEGGDNNDAPANYPSFI